MLRFYNRIKKIFRNINSHIFSFLVFASFSYITIGRNVNINGRRININKGCYIMDNSAILGDVTIGHNVFIHENVLIRSFRERISIGENTTINRNTNILSKVSIGCNCSIAPNVVIVGANHNFADNSRTIKEQGSTCRGIIIEDDVWIAANVTVCDGVKIGKGAVIGAGAVVVNDIPPFTVAAGVPAKVIKNRW